MEANKNFFHEVRRVYWACVMPALLSVYLIICMDTNRIAAIETREI